MNRFTLVASFFLFCLPAQARLTGTNPTGASSDAWCTGKVSVESCVDYLGDVIPTTNNTQSLGTSSLQFSSLPMGGVTQTVGYSPVFGSTEPTGSFSTASTSYLGIATMTVTGVKGSRPAYLIIHWNINNGSGGAKTYTYIVTANGVGLEAAQTIDNSGNSTGAVSEPYYIASTTAGTNRLVLNVKSNSATGTQTADFVKMEFLEF